MDQTDSKRSDAEQAQHNSPLALAQSISERWLGCPHCDLLVPRVSLGPGQKGRCPQCRYVLVEARENSIERTFAVALAGLIAFIPAMTFPLLGLQAAGFKNEASLWQCIQAMLKSDLFPAALVILLFCFLVPLARLLIIFHLSLQIMRNRHHAFDVPLFRIFHESEEWGMLEVFLFGLIVALYKILGVADPLFGFGLLAFVLLIVSSMLVTVFLDEQLVWEHLSDH